jgi:hypothetical protein
MTRRQLFAAFTGLLASLFMPKLRVKHGKYFTTVRDQHGRMVHYEPKTAFTNLAHVLPDTITVNNHPYRMVASNLEVTCGTYAREELLA